MGLINTDTITGSPTCVAAGAHANVGTYAITCSGADAGPNYAIGYLPGTLTVTGATLTVTAADQTKVYGASDPAFSFGISGLTNGDTTAVVTSPPTCTVIGGHTAAGSYTIGCSGGSAGGNYTIAYQVGTLTVGKAPLSITAVDRSVTFGDADPVFSFMPP